MLRLLGLATVTAVVVLILYVGLFMLLYGFFGA